MKICENLFTPIDHAIVRSSVRSLPGLLGAMIEMRFWQHMSFGEIADELGLSTRTVEAAMAQAMKLIREECLRHPVFSRSKFRALQTIQSKCVA